MNNNIYFNDIIKRWCKKCPICGDEQSYSEKNTSIKSLKKNIKCKKCNGNCKGGHLSNKTKEKLSLQKLGLKNPMFGKKHSNEFKKYLSDINKGSKNGFYGKHLTEKQKDILRKINKGKSPPNKGIAMSQEQKDKLRIIILSKLKGKNGDKIKANLRKGALKRLEKLKISSCEDEGAKEYFQWLNMYYGYNFKPKTFTEIGYVADGYDKNNHIWIEYDTPYHKLPSQKEKDYIRQQNIIKYFQSKNNPLNDFIRISVDKNKILCYA